MDTRLLDDHVALDRSVTRRTAEDNGEQQVQAFLTLFGAQLPNPASSLALIVRFRVKPGAQERCLSAFDEVVAPTSKEAGVSAFELHREAADSTRFVMYERWRSLADLGEHLRSPYISKLRRTLGEILDGNPEFQVVLPVFQSPQ